VSRLEDRTLLATVSWTNPAGGDWDTPSNWSTGNVLGPSDDAVIAIPGITVTHSDSAADAVNSLTISASDAALNLSNGSLAMAATSSIAGSVTMSGGTLSTAGSLTVSGSMDCTGGTITGGGALTCQGGISVSGSGAVLLDAISLNNYGSLDFSQSNSAPRVLLDAISLNNYGTATWNSGGLSAGDGAVINNEPGATFDAQSDFSLTYGSGAVPTFNNLAGATFMKSGGTGPSGTQMDLIFNNAGTVDVNSGGLTLGYFYVPGAAVSSGTFYGAPGTNLFFILAQDFTATSSINAANVAFNGFNGGVYDVEGSYAVSGQTLIDQANVNFTGTTVSNGSLGDSFDTQGGTANFSQTVPTSLTTDECTITGGLTGTDSFVINGPLTLSGSFYVGTTGTVDAQSSVAVSTGFNCQIQATTLNIHDAATLSGDYDVGVGNGATINNLGGATFDSQGGTGLGFGGGAVGTFNNDGTFTQSGGAGTGMGVVFNNSGSVLVSSGGLLLNFGGTGSGSFTSTAGTLTFNGNFDLGPTSSITAPEVDFNTLGGSVGNFNDAGSYQVSGSTVIRGGTETFTGIVTSVGSSLDIVPSNGNASANFSPATPITLTTNECTITGGLTGTDSFTIDGPLTLGLLDVAGASVSTSGTINAMGGMSITGGSLSGVTLNNYGAATWSGGPDIGLGNGAVFNNEPGASFDAQANDRFDWNGNGAVPAFNNLPGASFVSAGGLTQMGLAFTNDGTVDDQSGNLRLGGSFAGGLPVTNAGYVIVESGAILIALSDYDQTAGSTTLNGGTFFGGNLNIQGGALSGSGAVNANVTNAGQVIPGGTGAAGLLTINGNYTQTVSGSLNIEVGGTSADSQFDQLAVSGTASLGGMLNVATIGSFTPALGNMFQVLTFGSSSGNFMAYNGPNLAGGLFLDPVLNATNLTLDTDQVAIGGAPAFPLPGIPITLSGTVNGPSSGKTFAFSWTVTQNGNPFQSGSGSTFTFTPSLSATYLATLNVADAAGGKGTATLQRVVAPSIIVLDPTAGGALASRATPASTSPARSWSIRARAPPFRPAATSRSGRP